MATLASTVSIMAADASQSNSLVVLDNRKELSTTMRSYMKSFTLIERINDELGTTAKLQYFIFAAAESSLGSYKMMAAVMMRMGTYTRGVVQSHHELVESADQLQNTLSMGGGSALGLPAPQGAFDVAQQQASDGGKAKPASMFSKVIGKLGIAGKLKKAISVDSLKELASASDAYMNNLAQLNRVNDGLMTTEELQKRIYAAAERSRGSYSAMAASVVQLGVGAKKAFQSNEELVGFSELMQKSLRVGGASPEEQKSGSAILTKAMASGKLGGDDFSEIAKTAPLIAQAISKFTGKSIEDLKTMSAEGAISADIIKGAMFAASGDINSKFEELPVTFGDIGNAISNKLSQSIGPLLQKVNDWLNSPIGDALVNGIINSITLATEAVGGLVDGIMWIGGAIESIWPVAQPVLAGIIGAFAFWSLTQLPLLMTQINRLCIQLWLMIEPILAAAASWLILNWPILLIGAAIGFLIFSLYQWEDATAKVVGYIGGIFGTLFAWFWNKFALFANMILSVAEFFVNVWKDPMYATKKLFYDLVIDALKYLDNLASGIEGIINKIPGIHVNMTGSMDNLLNQLERERDNLKSKEDVIQLTKFEQLDYGDAFNKGQELGEKASHWASDGLQGLAGKAGDMMGSLFGKKGSGEDGVFTPGASQSSNALDSIGKVGEVGKVRDTVDISSEDIKLMRELAEMNNVQNFMSVSPQLSFGDTHVRQDGRSVDEIIANITERMNQEIVSSAKGVYGHG
ncbi:tape measure protein [Paenibacillus sp. HB172176]|uniref:tape measure protein n=1 Tax=Paenibacillus sp. HB172176 TaxID=2493690 RepID=UPI00143A31C6|nr:tape measure protein [Paenibacillus sp. HB172176]